MSQSPDKPIPVLRIALRCGALGLLALVAAGFAGCKPKEAPSAPSAPPVPAAATPGKWTLAPDKETVVNDASGAQITVPAGAVGENHELTLTTAPPEAQPGAVGRVVDLGIAGEAHYRFKKPIRVSLPYDPALVKEGYEVVVSRWDSGRWQKIKGSRVEGDRAVAEIDHFSTYAPTPARKSPTKEPSLPRHPLFEVGGWDVQIDVEMSGDWSKQEKTFQSHGNLSRSGSVRFQLSTWHVDADNKYASWSTPYKNWPPGDETRVTWNLHDYFMETDNDQDKTGNVFYYHTSDGADRVQKHVINSLKIDAVQGTWSLSGGQVSAGKTACRDWDSWGKSSSPPGEAVSLHYPSITQPLPADGQVLTHTVKLTKKSEGWISAGFPGPAGIQQLEGLAVITITPLGGVMARIRPPYECRRGDEVTLDAAESLGDVSSYHWKVTVDPSCPDAPESMKHEGPTWKFQALWDFKAQLEITSKDGKKSEVTRRFRVQPRRGREWQLRFQTKKDTSLNKPMTAREMQLGINQCSLEKLNDDESGHKIHSVAKDRPVTWQDGAYAIRPVDDDGPFKGLHYAADPNFLVDRVERVNQTLAKGGAIHELNTKAGNLELIGRLQARIKKDPEDFGAKDLLLKAQNHNPQDIEKLFEQVTDHEAAHSKLMQTAYLLLTGQGKDPGPLVEKVVSADESKVKDSADGYIRTAETDLFESTEESKVKKVLDIPKYQRYVHLWFPDGNGSVVNVELGPLFSLGDDEKK